MGGRDPGEPTPNGPIRNHRSFRRDTGGDDDPDRRQHRGVFRSTGPARERGHRFLYTYALVPAVYGHPDLARQAGLDPDNYWPLLTNTFMHAGYLHLIVNMWTLWLFGAPVDRGVHP